MSCLRILQDGLMKFLSCSIIWYLASGSVSPDCVPSSLLWFHAWYFCENFLVCSKNTMSVYSIRLADEISSCFINYCSSGSASPVCKPFLLCFHVWYFLRKYGCLLKKYQAFMLFNDAYNEHVLTFYDPHTFGSASPLFFSSFILSSLLLSFLPFSCRFLPSPFSSFLLSFLLLSFLPFSYLFFPSSRCNSLVSAWVLGRGNSVVYSKTIYSSYTVRIYSWKSFSWSFMTYVWGRCAALLFVFLTFFLYVTTV